MMSSEIYKFVPVTEADIPLLKVWLSEPEVRRWWGDPDKEVALIEGDVGNPQISLNLVHIDEKPFAFIQDYDVHAWPEKYREPLPKGTRSIDVFIGNSELRGKGHGPKFLRLRAGQLLQNGSPMVVIDPLRTNLNARAAYIKAGFVGDEIFDTDEGPIVLMTFQGSV